MAEFYEYQLQQLLARNTRLINQLSHFEAATQGHLLKQPSPNSLQKALKTLEVAMVQFYRHLMLLDNYALLNYTAFQRLLMKHDRITHLSSIEYLEVLQRAPFVLRSTLTSLISETEDQFRKLFTRGNLQTAKAKLLARQHDYFDRNVFELGLVVGAAACTFLLLVFLLAQGNVQSVNGPEGWYQVLPVYRLSAIPILSIWLWAINVLIWHRTRVNYVYIFDLSPTSALSYIHLFKFAGFLTLLWCTSFFLYVGSAGGHFQPGSPKIFPLALTVLLFFIIVCPLNILYRSSRVFFLQVLLSVVLAPFGRLRFVDGYVGDLLTSMVKTLGDAEYTVCYYSSAEWIADGGQCKIINRYGAAVVGCLPLFWRMMQCLGRYSASKHIEHLGNSTKYVVALSVVLFSQLNGDFSAAGDWNALRLLWCISFIVSTLYSYVWDIFMDWGLGRFNSHNFLLRDELFYSNRKWFYYYCIVSNLVFRFFWTITLSGSPISIGIDSTTLGWIAALVEVFRRFTWSLLRVENEYQSKASDVTVSRDTDFIPLPFQVNQVEMLALEENEWLDDSSHKNYTSPDHGIHSRSLSNEGDGDLDMLYSINSG